MYCDQRNAEADAHMCGTDRLHTRTHDAVMIYIDAVLRAKAPGFPS